MRYLTSRYSRRPSRPSYRLQTERTEKQIRTFKKLVKRMQKDYDTLEDLTADMFPNRNNSHAKDVWNEIYRLQNTLYMLEYHVG